jgi:hypothetical protein
MRVLLMLIALSTVTFNLYAEDAKHDEAYMEAMKKMATPGEHHEVLKKMIGMWTVSSKMWKDPTSTPMESVGTSENKMILGDRFLSQEFHGTHMNQPFMGMGLMGFDNQTKKFVSTWVDDMSTGIMVSYGTMDKGKNMITQMGEMKNPMTNKSMKLKMVTRIESDTKHVFEMWCNDKKGKMFKSMELVYTKK